MGFNGLHLKAGDYYFEIGLEIVENKNPTITGFYIWLGGV
jgi:hypothetical protein